MHQTDLCREAVQLFLEVHGLGLDKADAVGQRLRNVGTSGHSGFDHD